MTANYYKYHLDFKKPSGTSRGVLHTKETWFIILKEGDCFGIGECGLLRGLSIDDRPDYEGKLKWVCNNISLGLTELLAKTIEYPSIQFGLETAFKSIQAENSYILFPSKFTNGEKGIPINGLVWMGEKSFMKQQIIDKINAGFKCIKLKIGAIDFTSELELLKFIRQEFSTNDIEIRVDANGAFSPDTALKKLEQLSAYSLHSIEQPIAPKQWQVMAELCEKTPLDIALDEELIGVFKTNDRENLLNTIKPQYIILKPSLVGGIKNSESWIELADKRNTGWWVTSALESNIGLNAISQFTYTTKSTMYQGLGTGGLYTNNFTSPLEIDKGNIWHKPSTHWQVDLP